MSAHPLISTLLAIWFSLGAGLGPRFLCVCADGTATTQFGEQFCCDGPGEAPCPIPSEDGEDASHSVACSDGRCQSTEVESESIVAVDRLEKDTDKDWSFDGPNDPVFPWFKFLANGSASTTFTLRPPVPLDVETSGCHLRSVILLV